MNKQTTSMIFSKKIGLGCAAMFSCMLLKNDHVLAEALPETMQPEISNNVVAKMITDDQPVSSTIVEETSVTPSLDETSETKQVNAGLVQHYDFDSATSSDITVTDKITGQQATIVGDNVVIAENVDEVFGNAIQFEEGQGGHLKIPNAINTAESDHTFALWSKYDTTIPEENKSSAAVVLQQDGPGKTLLDIKSDGRLNTYAYGKNADGDKAVENNKWQHLALSIDSTNNIGAFYINGELDKVVELGNNKVDRPTNLLIGSHKNFGTDPHQFHGLIDDIRIYNRKLSDDDIYQIYQEKGSKIFVHDEMQPLLQEAKALLQAKGIVEINPLFQNLKQTVATIDLTKNNNLDQLKSQYHQLKLSVNQYREAMPVSITVNIDEVQREIDAKHIFGINHRYAFNGYGSFDETTGKVRDEFAELYKKAGFGSIRYPGGTISNLFNWKTAIGPMEERKKQIHGFYNNPGQNGIAPNFGLSEIATFAKSVDSEMVYVYSLGRGNSQDAADLIEFLNAKVGTNPNGGVDWAQVRADLGHKEPFNIKYFEIGNEMNQGNANGEGTYSQTYWTAFAKMKNSEAAYTEGGKAVFKNQYAVDEENWNKEASRSTGEANLTRYMRYANINPKKYINGKIIDDPDFVAVDQSSIKVFVGDNQQNKEAWKIVPDFSQSLANDKHVVVDYSTGALHFGDGVRGKIPEKNKLIFVSYSVNREGFVQIAQKIKDTMKQISDLEHGDKKAYVFSGYESPKFIKHMAKLKTEDLYDGLTIHPYSGHVNGGKQADQFYDNAMLLAENKGVKHVKDYVDLLPAGKVPVISEFGIFRNTEAQVRSLTHALYIGKTLMDYVKLGSPYIQKHALVDWYSTGSDALGPTQQAVIQAVAQAGADTHTGQGEFKYFATPSAHVFEMLNKGFGNHILNSTISNIPQLANQVNAVSTLVSKDDNGNVYIALINVDREKAYPINLNFDNLQLNGRLVEVQELTSANITDENTLEQPNKVHINNHSFTYSADKMYQIKPHSFVVLKIVAPSTPISAPKVETTPTQPPKVTPTKQEAVKVQPPKVTPTKKVIKQEVVKVAQPPRQQVVTTPHTLKVVSAQSTNHKIVPKKVTMKGQSKVVTKQSQAPLGKVVKQLPATGEKVSHFGPMTLATNIIVTILSAFGLYQHKMKHR